MEIDPGFTIAAIWLQSCFLLAFVSTAFAFGPLRNGAQHLALPTISGVRAHRDFQEWQASERNMHGLKKWAVESGIEMNDGLDISPTISTAGASDAVDDNNMDWQLKLVRQPHGHNILTIPASIILSWKTVADEFGKKGIDTHSVRAYLEARRCQDQIPQFFLWLRVLEEYAKGEKSKWFAWIESLPRRFDSALYMNDGELDCLPPHAWSLAKHQIHNLKVFQSLLNETFEDHFPNKIHHDSDLLRWALCVVFARCWWEEGSGLDADCHLVPMGDMLNHGYPASTFISYDDNGYCTIALKANETLATATPLSLSYGGTKNPSRFLVLYGFVDDTQQDIFSQILVSNPSQQHVDIGYSSDRMTVSTKDGSLSQEVLDVTLFAILEQAPDAQKAFYLALTSDDWQASKKIREKFLLEILIVLKKQMDAKASEFVGYAQKAEKRLARDPLNRRLEMILRHNAFLCATFQKSQAVLKERICGEMARRKGNGSKVPN